MSNINFEDLSYDEEKLYYDYAEKIHEMGLHLDISLIELAKQIYLAQKLKDENDGN